MDREPDQEQATSRPYMCHIRSTVKPPNTEAPPLHTQEEAELWIVNLIRNARLVAQPSTPQGYLAHEQQPAPLGPP